jgi:rubrerythrin
MNQKQAPPAINSTEELLAYSLALESEAVERFNELADQMELHYNFDVADLFRKLADIEGIHVDNVMKASKGMELPAMHAWEFEWEGGESPEGGSREDAHYLMEAWHAIELAMQGEKRAVAFYRHVMDTATSEDVVNMAKELVEEEEEHVFLLQKWQQRFPKPEDDWDDDPDPPNISE